MDWIVSPEGERRRWREWFGEAPANAKACDQTADKEHCATYHADGRGLLRQDLVLDHADRGSASTARNDVQVHDYSQWTQAWTEIKG